MEENKEPINPDAVKTRTTQTKTQIKEEVKNRSKNNKLAEKPKTPLGKANKIVSILFFVSLGISAAMSILGLLCILATVMWALVVAVLLICTLFIILFYYPELLSKDSAKIAESVVNFGNKLLGISAWAWLATACLGAVWIVVGVFYAKELKKAKEKAKAAEALQGESAAATENKTEENKTTIDGKEI